MLRLEDGETVSGLFPTLKIPRLHRQLSQGREFQVVVESNQVLKADRAPFLVRASRIEECAGSYDLLQVIDATRLMGDVEIYRSYAQLVESSQRKMELRLSSFPEENRDPVLACSVDGVVTYRNPACERLLGEMGVQNLTHLLPVNHVDLVGQAVAAPEDFLVAETKQAGRVFGWKYRAVLDGTLVHLYGTELTAIREAEVSRRRMQDQLAQMKRVASLGHLAGGIAHDFNNILTAVVGCAQLSLDEFSDGPFVRENLEEILRASSRAKGIISQILAFSRAGGDQASPVSIREVLEEVVRLQQVSLPERIGLRVNFNGISGLEGFVLGDVNQLHQVFMNLIGNAVHAVKTEGTEIGIEVRACEDAEMSMLQIVVEDDGVGMSSETKRHIFDPYYTTRGLGEGSGLGLAVAHGVVHKFGGRIDVESVLGQGSAFTVLLPRYSGESVAPSPERIAKSPESSLAVLRLMVVDDEPSVARVTALMMQRLGHRVEVFHDPALALKELEQTRFDLLITDHSMPEMTGMELITAAKKLHPSLPIIMCSGYGARLDEQKVLDVGARALFWKPIDFARLAEMVELVAVEGMLQDN
jgi:signal transduction histidine kinase